MCVFLIQKMETSIFLLLENTFLNRSFDEKLETAKRGKCYEKPCSCLCIVEQKQLHTTFLALKFDEKLWPTDFVLCDLE